MKSLHAILAILCINTALAQDSKVVYKVVPIQSAQKFFLNGGARADFGGRSRETIMVSLPPNTVEWYYAYTSSANQNPTQSINLVQQLLRCLAPGEGILTDAVAKIISPTGAGVCDVFLFQDQLSVNDFVNKKGQMAYDQYGTRLNFKEGVVRIKDALKGPYVLGIRNPSGLEGVNVSIEIAAIVATSVPISKTPSQQEASLYGELGEKAYQEGEYVKAIEYNKKALVLDSTLCSAAGNLALIYLITGKEEAVDSYVHAVELMKQSSLAKQLLAKTVYNLEEAKRKFENLKDFDLIRGLLQDELAKH